MKRREGGEAGNLVQASQLSLSLSSLCLFFIYSIPTEKLYEATCTTPKNIIMQIQLGEEKVEELIVK